jgi:hypothetical protein
MGLLSHWAFKVQGRELHLGYICGGKRGPRADYAAWSAKSDLARSRPHLWDDCRNFARVSAFSPTRINRSNNKVIGLARLDCRVHIGCSSDRGGSQLRVGAAAHRGPIPIISRNRGCARRPSQRYRMRYCLNACPGQGNRFRGIRGITGYRNVARDEPRPSRSENDI